MTAVRRAIQDSQESLRALARRHGINPKTVAKWRQRRTLDDRKTGPKEPRSTVLTIEEDDPRGRSDEDGNNLGAVGLFSHGRYDYGPGCPISDLGIC